MWNNFSHIKDHVAKIHPDKYLVAFTPTDIQQCPVVNDPAPFKNDDSVASTYGGLVNDGKETKADYFGHNDTLDECHANCLVDMMSKKDSDNQCNSHEYSPRPPGLKVLNLNPFEFLAIKSQTCTFYKTTFVDRTKNHVEGSVTLCGGRFSGRICMKETILHYWIMQGCYST